MKKYQKMVMDKTVIDETFNTYVDTWTFWSSRTDFPYLQRIALRCFKCVWNSSGIERSFRDYSQITQNPHRALYPTIPKF